MGNGDKAAEARS